MEKLNLSELISIAKSVYPDYDVLLRQDVDGSLVDLQGIVHEPDSDVSANSDVSYDKLSALIKVLTGIYEYRPLPF